MRYSNKEDTLPFKEAPYGDCVKTYIGDNVAIVKDFKGRQVYLRIGSWDPKLDELNIEDRYTSLVNGQRLATTLRHLHVIELEDDRVKAENDRNEALWAPGRHNPTNR